MPIICTPFNSSKKRRKGEWKLDQEEEGKERNGRKYYYTRNQCGQLLAKLPHLECDFSVFFFKWKKIC